MIIVNNISILLIMAVNMKLSIREVLIYTLRVQNVFWKFHYQEASSVYPLDEIVQGVPFTEQIDYLQSFPFSELLLNLRKLSIQ